MQAACTAGAAREDDGVPRVVPRATAAATQLAVSPCHRGSSGSLGGLFPALCKTVKGNSFLLRCVRPAGRLGINAVKMKLGQIKPANKKIDHTNRIVLAYPIFRSFRKQRDLLAIHSLQRPGSELQSPTRSFCVQHGGNGRQRVIALAKSLKRGKRILASRGGSRSARRTHRFWRLRSRPSRWRRQRRIALATAVDALRLHFGPVEG